MESLRMGRRAWPTSTSWSSGPVCPREPQQQIQGLVVLVADAGATFEVGQVIAALLALGLDALKIKEAAIADFQGPGGGSHLGQGGGTIGGASILQGGHLQTTTEGIIAQMQFAGRQAGFWGTAPTALEQAGQFIGQADAGAIFQRDRGKALQQRDSDRISHNQLGEGHLKEGLLRRRRLAG
jgi:hypothetical protein